MQNCVCTLGNGTGLLISCDGNRDHRHKIIKSTAPLQISMILKFQTLAKKKNNNFPILNLPPSEKGSSWNYF